ncbi:hypothetical protein ACROSR_18400 [Roseovarius tibetensis]|uniref:hypothetical protein n=1 Tax=Roseovarius tibetensis TaxID=2685897 RepID=UPI003D7F77CF
MAFYVLLTHGARPTGNFRDHPAARSQVRYYDQVCSLKGIQKPQYFCDYARKANSLACLPNLKFVLEKLENEGEGSVVVDDVARLTKICDWRYRSDFVAELMIYGRWIYSILHKSTLSDVSDSAIRLVTHHPEKSKHPAQQRRHQNTVAARSSSAASRSNTALENARALAAVRDEIVAAHGAATLKQISDEATARGLTSTTGKNWTPQNVARSLKLLESKGNVD